MWQKGEWETNRIMEERGRGRSPLVVLSAPDTKDTGTSWGQRVCDSQLFYPMPPHHHLISWCHQMNFLLFPFCQWSWFSSYFCTKLLMENVFFVEEHLISMKGLKFNNISREVRDDDDHQEIHPQIQTTPSSSGRLLLCSLCNIWWLKATRSGNTFDESAID